MTFRIHAVTSFPTTDNQRDHARIISGLEAATAVYEAAIKEVSGCDVKIDLRAKRANAPKETATLPAQPSLVATAPMTEAAE